MTREYAIRWLSQKLKVSRQNAEDCETEWFATKSMYHTAVAVYEMAISALREQEERSKGCEFCKGAKYIYGELSASGHADDDHDFVHEQYGDFPICAMCGRRLEEV